jgi:hypothetical protein
LVPVSDRVATPVFVSVAPDPDTTPLKVPVPEATSTVPAVVMLTLFEGAMLDPRANVVPLAMLRVPEPRPLLWLREIVPRERFVPPVCVSATLMVRVPAPAFPIVPPCPAIGSVERVSVVATSSSKTPPALTVRDEGIFVSNVVLNVPPLDTVAPLLLAILPVTESLPAVIAVAPA